MICYICLLLYLDFIYCYKDAIASQLDGIIYRYLKRSLKPEPSLFFPAILLQSSPLHRKGVSSILHGFHPHKFGKGHSPLAISGILHMLECFFGVLLYSPLVCFLSG